jgi:ABC-type oligopeptide transport system ATPase subunit
MAGDADDHNILVKSLRKVYPPRKGIVGSKPKEAVKDLSLAIPVGECFGLLGLSNCSKLRFNCKANSRLQE